MVQCVKCVTRFTAEVAVLSVSPSPRERDEREQSQAEAGQRDNQRRWEHQSLV